MLRKRSCLAMWGVGWMLMACSSPPKPRLEATGSLRQTLVPLAIGRPSKA